MNRNVIAALLLFSVATPCMAQTNASQVSLPVDGKIRVHVTDSQSWEMSGGFGGANGAAAGAQRGGARPQTGEIVKTLNDRCPQITVTMSKDRADYILLLDHEGAKGAGRKDNKVALYRADGDVIFSNSTRTLGNAVKDACSAVLKDSRR